jgi:hypothetical protein
MIQLPWYPHHWVCSTAEEAREAVERELAYITEHGHCTPIVVIGNDET